MWNIFRWQSGRQNSGYEKMLLFASWWPVPFDSYLIRYKSGSRIPLHVDKVESGRHYRLNFILKAPEIGGDFICENPIFESKRIKLFRPDISKHMVTRVEGGNRYVLSIGWILNSK